MRGIPKAIPFFAGLVLLSGLFTLLGRGDASPGRAYWVSPTGAAAWADAHSSTPLLGKACSSLATANVNASAGDTVFLRGGTYGTGIRPSRSGAPGRVIAFIAFSGEKPRIRAVFPSRDMAGGGW